MSLYVVRLPYGSGGEYSLRFRFSLYRLTGNTQGVLRLKISGSSTYYEVDVTQYPVDVWSLVELTRRVFVITSKGSQQPYITVSPTKPMAGAGVMIANLSVTDDKTTFGVPQKTASAAYTLSVADEGKHIYISTGGVTIPNNADASIPVEATVTIVNNSGSDQTIGKGGSVTLYYNGASVSTITLGARKMITLLKAATDTWYA